MVTRDQDIDYELVRYAARWRHLKVMDKERAGRPCREQRPHMMREDIDERTARRNPPLELLLSQGLL